MIEFGKFLFKVKNFSCGRSTSTVIYIISALTVASIFIGVIQDPVRPAYGDILLFIQDQSSCEDSPINGLMNVSNTCLLVNGLTLNADIDVEISSGITAILLDGRAININLGRTLYLADGGTLNSFGTIQNNGTINNNGTFTHCGIFVNDGTLTGNPIIDFCDSDGDRIADDIDTHPNSFSNTFINGEIASNTTGIITSRGGQLLTILNAPSPDGVEIKAAPSGSGGDAKITACGSAIYSLSAGDEIIVTCGSVTTQVIQGPAHVEFIGADGSTASSTIEAGNTLTFDPDTFSFDAPESNSDSINIITGGNTVIVDPGETIQQFSVSIDIKPDDTPNTVNIKKDKIVTVALLGSSTFGVNSVDKSTLRFGGHTLQPAIKTSLQDVNKDSFIDLVMQFKVTALGFSVSDTQGCLTALLQDGTPIMGCDSVRILNK